MNMTVIGSEGKRRCFGGNTNQGLYASYHDNEWGVASHDDRHLFEMLILEGAQAGLNWETILKKREAYRKAFHNFDPVNVANMTEAELESLRIKSEIIRNRLKIFSAKQNARVFIQIVEEFGSFDRYVWRFVNGSPIVNSWQSHADIPTSSPESEALSKDLKKRGMSFVGPKIIYAYMQAVGMVNDHMTTCWRYGK